MQMALTLYTIPFNCSFVYRSSGFLKTRPDVFSDLIAVLKFSPFKIRLIRSYTPLTYGIDAYAFGFSRAFACAMFGWSTDFMKFSG